MEADALLKGGHVGTAQGRPQDAVDVLWKCSPGKYEAFTAGNTNLYCKAVSYKCLSVCIFVACFSEVCLFELVTTSASIDLCPVTVINEFVFKQL